MGEQAVGDIDVFVSHFCHINGCFLPQQALHDGKKILFLVVLC
ncbi:MAG: hypothetical protein Q4A06_10065 [Cardiobacteriaceae bacterium]|nr:hypothetical protein [Cardiobacteriaceae bacterium]